MSSIIHQRLSVWCLIRDESMTMAGQGSFIDNSGQRVRSRHAELVSASILGTSVRAAKWTLKQVQGDELARGERSVRVLKVLGTFLTVAVMVMAYFAHPEGSPVRPYLEAIIPVWMAVLLFTGWIEYRRQRAKLKGSGR